ncbi:MAG TPA: hypothetical protein VJY65_02110, partial [Chloroflexota bacterium]|nr:hypothetical protein [Chloroflexota bacterium]
MLPETWRIGLASPRVATTREEGLATAGRFLAEAALHAAAIVCFPETSLPGYRGLDIPTPPPDQRAGARPAGCEPVGAQASGSGDHAHGVGDHTHRSAYAAPYRKPRAR